jgi:hypothetical protein
LVLSFRAKSRNLWFYSKNSKQEMSRRNST